MNMNRIWKEPVMAYVMALSSHSPCKTEENHINLDMNFQIHTVTSTKIEVF
jgi:hypothetical protein